MVTACTNFEDIARTKIKYDVVNAVDMLSRDL